MPNANNENSFQAPGGQRPSGPDQRPLAGHPPSLGRGQVLAEPLRREASEIRRGTFPLPFKGTWKSNSTK